MKYISVLTVCVLILFSACVSVQVAENQFSQDWVESQYFELTDSTEAIVIEADMGTKLYIAADTFETENPVTIEVKEIYSIEDMVFSNLSTETDYGILQSAGMVYIQATDSVSGQVLRPRNSVGIAMPKKHLEIDGRLYFGTEIDGIVSWEAPDDYQADLDKSSLGLLDEDVSSLDDMFWGEDRFSSEAPDVEGEDELFTTLPSPVFVHDDASDAFWALDNQVYNQLTVWRFGWINCDILLIPMNPVDLSVGLPDSLFAKIYFIFDDINSVIVRFTDVSGEESAGEAPKLFLRRIEKGTKLSVFAIGQDIDGNAFYSEVKSIVAGETDSIELLFNETELPDLQFSLR